MSTKKQHTDSVNLRRVSIDTAKAQLKDNMRYKGNGMVSANNTSRLLIDYKAMHPVAYTQLLQLLFAAIDDGGVVSEEYSSYGRDGGEEYHVSHVN